MGANVNQVRINIATQNIRHRRSQVKVKLLTTGPPFCITTNSNTRIQKSYEPTMWSALAHMFQKAPISKILIHIDMVCLCELILQQFLPGQRSCQLPDPTSRSRIRPKDFLGSLVKFMNQLLVKRRNMRTQSEGVASRKFFDMITNTGYPAEDLDTRGSALTLERSESVCIKTPMHLKMLPKSAAMANISKTLQSRIIAYPPAGCSQLAIRPYKMQSQRMKPPRIAN